MKIAIATAGMGIGGIERSLLELCRELTKKGIKLTVFLESVDGELLNELPAQIKVFPIFKGYENIPNIIKKAFREHRIAAVKGAVWFLLFGKKQSDPLKYWNRVLDYMKPIESQYDYAFAYGYPVSFSNEFIRRLICAKNKYVWIHNDPRNISLDIKKYKQCYKDFSKIVCVSKGTQRAFESIFPEYAPRTTVFYNIINKSDIIRLSKEKIELSNSSCIRLLTVGRLCYEKGQDLIPTIAAKLKEDGYKFTWFCVGEGSLHNEIEKKIEAAKVRDCVKLIESTANPYPWFKLSDMYIQTSRTEGFGITISEAKLFNLPIISTNFECAYEQLQDGKTGIIVPFDEDALYYAIKSLLDNPKLRATFSNALSEEKRNLSSDIDLLLGKTI